MASLIERLPMSGKRRAELSLVTVTVVWGMTFSLVKMSLEELQPFVFMAWRFGLAAVVMAAICARKMRSIDRGVLKAGLILGFVLYVSYATQTFGLKYTTAGNAGFITGLFIVFVPALSVLFLRRVPGTRAGLHDRLEMESTCSTPYAPM